MNDATLIEPSKLELLKQKADLLGIKYHPAIGEEALATKIKEHLDKTSSEDSVDINEVRKRVHDEALKLIRCRISCLNPDKGALQGEVFTIANDVIGTVSKFVPYDEAGESYHLPNCIYQHLKARKFLSIRESYDNRAKRSVITQKWVPEFNIEVLPPLTKEELQELANAQAMAGNIDDSGSDLN